MTQPHSFMLNYLPAATTPTRIRKVACIGLLAAAVVYCAAGVFIGWIAERQGARMAYYYVGPSPTILYIWGYMPKGIVTVAASVMAAAILLTICTTAVYRGKVWANIVSQVLLIPLLLLFCCVAALSLSIPPLAAASASTKEWAIGIPTFIVTLLLALLTLDVGSYLRWLRRRPREEMPKRPFV